MWLAFYFRVLALRQQNADLVSLRFETVGEWETAVLSHGCLLRR